LDTFLGIWKEDKTKSREEFDNFLLSKDWDKFADSLVDAAEGWDSYGWEFVCEENGVTVTRTSVPNSSIKCTKGVAVFIASPKDVFEIVKAIPKYKSWDPKIIESKVIHTLNSNTSTNYFEFGPWFPVSAREVVFVQYTTRQNDGTYVVAWHSVDDPDVSKKKGVVRATMGTSGFVISPLQNQSLVTFILQFDLKGWIPTNTINQITASFPLILDPIYKYLLQSKASVVSPTPSTSQLKSTEPTITGKTE